MFKPITQKMVAKDLLINPTQPVPSGNDFPSQCFASNDFKTIVAPKPSGLVYICDGISGAINASFTPDSTSYPFEISADGRFIVDSNFIFVSGGKYVGRVRVFDRTGTIVRTYNNPRSGYDDFFGNRTALSRDGSVIAIGAPIYSNQPTNSNIYGRVFVYNNNTGALITTILDPTGSQSSSSPSYFGQNLKLSGDGTKIAIGSYAYDVGATLNVGRIYIYNATNGSLIRTIESPLVQANRYFGRDLSLSDDGRRLIATVTMPVSPNEFGSYRGYLFDVDTGGLLTTFNDPKPTIYTVRYSGIISADGSTCMFYRAQTADTYPIVEMYIYRNENPTIVKTLTTARPQDFNDIWNAVLNQDGTMISYPDTDYYYSGPTGGLVVKTIV